jgi:uncharacterized protein
MTTSPFKSRVEIIIPRLVYEFNKQPMTNRQEVITRLRSLKAELSAQYDVKEIGIFGSVARGDEGPESDLDLIVEFGPDADLITYIGLWQFLEDVFKIKIDLISKKGLRFDMRKNVMRDFVLV